MNRSADLHAEQIDAISTFLKRKRVVFRPGPGFGKTIIGLTTAKLFADKGVKTLIVANSGAIKHTWSSHHKEWEHTQTLNVVALQGSPSKRKKLLDSGADVYAISYNLLPWLKQACPRNLKFKLVVADECSCLKAPDSVWRAALCSLSRHADWRMGLSATPITRDVSDAWGLCRWLDDGAALGRTITDFRNRYMRSVIMSGTGVVLWQMRDDRAREEVRRRFKHLFVSYEPPKGADIPIHLSILSAELSPHARRVYDAMKQRGDMLVGTRMVASEKPLSALEISNKLSMITSGFVYDTVVEQLSMADLVDASATPKDLIAKATSRSAIRLFSDRMDLMRRALVMVRRKHPGENICVTYHYKHELEQLKELLPEGVEDTEDRFQDRWNNGEIPCLFMQYTRSSKSLNLQHGGHVMIAYSATFNFEDAYQIVRRLARQGQKAEKVYLYSLHFSDTYDDIKRKAIERRQAEDSRLHIQALRG